MSIHPIIKRFCIFLIYLFKIHPIMYNDQNIKDHEDLIAYDK